MAEYIIALVIVVLVGVAMMLIGVWQIRSKKPVGFYSGETPPRENQLTDVAAWNHKHGYMFVAYGLVIIGAFVAASFVASETMAMVLIFGGVVGALPVMMWYHSRLKKKYYK